MMKRFLLLTSMLLLIGCATNEPPVFKCKDSEIDYIPKGSRHEKHYNYAKIRCEIKKNPQDSQHIAEIFEYSHLRTNATDGAKYRNPESQTRYYYEDHYWESKRDKELKERDEELKLEKEEKERYDLEYRKKMGTGSDYIYNELKTAFVGKSYNPPKKKIDSITHDSPIVKHLEQIYSSIPKDHYELMYEDGTIIKLDKNFELMNDTQDIHKSNHNDKIRFTKYATFKDKHPKTYIALSIISIPVLLPIAIITMPITIPLLMYANSNSKSDQKHITKIEQSTPPLPSI